MNELSISVRNLTKSFEGRTVVVFAAIASGVVAGWMPLGVGIQLLKSISMGCYDNVVMPVVTLTVIAVVCGVVAVKTFRWE